MKLNTNKNSYILVYASVMVVIVAFLLAFLSKLLEERINENVRLDKKKQILRALQYNVDSLGNEKSAVLYADVVKSDDIIDDKGNIIEVVDDKGVKVTGFDLKSSDMKEGKLAVFTCDVDGATKYVLPVYGNGLWGAIWGYVALNEDRQTVYGVFFNHESETAGLGAEIKDSKAWQQLFVGKKVMLSDDVALKVVKGAKNGDYEVNAVTGATLTSNGVSDMLQESLAKYKPFLTEGGQVNE